MSRLYLTSFATERFSSVQRDLNISAVRFGIPNLLTYSEADLYKSDFYSKNRNILDETCGAGFWAWKPYFVLQALNSIQDGDILFYCDAGSLFLESPIPLIRLCSNSPQSMVFFDARPLSNSQFTKRDCFVRLECDEPRIWNARKVIATLFVLQKKNSTISFVEEWLRHCQDRAALTDDPNTCGYENLPGFLQHRWDQAILSVLCAKHDIETYRNPTFWGNFLKMPQYRVQGEPIISPYNLPPYIATYSDLPQANSPYGTIFEINRLPNFVGKVPFEYESDAPDRSLFRRTIWFLKRLYGRCRSKYLAVKKRGRTE